MAENKPNVVFMLADNLGSGDLWVPKTRLAL